MLGDGSSEGGAGRHISFLRLLLTIRNRTDLKTSAALGLHFREKCESPGRHQNAPATAVVAQRGLVNVRFTPKATEVLRCRKASLCARRRPEQAQQARSRCCGYSITSLASICIEIGTSIPRALAVFALSTSSNLVDCCTGKSAGFAPLRMRPV